MKVIISKNKKHTDSVFLILLFAILGYLRLANLSYAEFSTDEVPVMGPIKRGENIFSADFLLSQYKGPLQFIIAQLINFAGVDIFNEFGYRLVFAFLGILAFCVFYLYLKALTNNSLISFLVTLIFGVNGFTVGLTRIVQYQSLNMLFSILALYFYYAYFQNQKLKNSLLGTFFISLSFLAHWDAIFVFPIILYYLLKKPNFKYLALNLVLSAILLLPFLVPYIVYTFQNGQATSYFNSRIGIPQQTLVERLKYYDFYTRLYNPFVFIEFFVSAAVVALALAWRRIPYIAWFVITLAVFTLLVRRSGTHLYNVLIPFSVVLALGLQELCRQRNVVAKITKILFSAALVVLAVFFWYQSWLLFVDYSTEYPWEREKILGKYKTTQYDTKSLTNNIVGFPINRQWKQAREVLEQNFDNYNQFTYITNERDDSPNYYLDLVYGKSNKMFVFGVKTPSSFMNDYKFSSVKNKKTFIKLKDEDGKTVNTIYVVQPTGEY